MYRTFAGGGQLGTGNKGRSESFLQSYVHLSIVNILNVVLPLLTVPYLLTVLGTNGYGVLAYHQYISQFFIVVLDFGFPLYAVKEVALRADNERDLAELISNIYVIKLGVLGVGIFVTLFLYATVSGFRNSVNPCLLAGFLGAAALNSFAPNWLYQGLEQLKATVLPNFVARLVTLLLTFAVVRAPSDLAYASYPYLAGALVLLFALFWKAYTRFDGVSIPEWWRLKQVFFESFQVFVSRLAIMGYVTVSPLLINATAGPNGVAVYNLCEKIIGLARIPFDTISSASYGGFSREYRKVRARKFLIWVFVAGVIATVGVSLFSIFVDKEVPKMASLHLSRYLPFYSLGLFAIAMHGFLGTCVLLANGKRFQLTASIFGGFAVYALCVGMFWHLVADKVLLAVLSMVAVEFGILVVRFVFSFRYKLI